MQKSLLGKLFSSQFILLGGLMLMISANARAAQPVCNTIAECQALRILVDARIKELQAVQNSVFLDIARDANSKVSYMTQSDAVQYCANLGAHLPSARELAQLAVSLGAIGIVNSCGTDKICYKISDILNVDGSKEDFYFSYSGYQRPEGDLGHNYFWSSSVNSNNSDHAIVLTSIGALDYDSGNYPPYNFKAVRCVSGR